MKLLLDTHIFIWWAEEPARLAPATLAALEDESNDLVLSVASVWEMQIKIQIGKMRLSQSLPALIASQQQANNLRILSIEYAHVLTLDSLPLHHNDPFDRAIIAQAVTGGYTLVSADTKFSAYTVNLLN